MPNQLANASSPYLLQHQHNPVNWYPWDQQALRIAADEQKPIFLSIGYSACHWCHVMEHESFEDTDIADYLNAHFVSIKVDREERPDLDQIYMNAVQIMTGRGGWPMSVFLTPSLQPFYGGTYWPPQPRMGMPGFLQVLHAVQDAWINRREQAEEQARDLTNRIQSVADIEAPDSPFPDSFLLDACVQLEKSFDARWGGFGSAPKFPHPMNLQLLLRAWKRSPHDAVLTMVTTTLDRMCAGGIYDHLAGGFARYSVDNKWLVPHFEKMLYDNALLVNAYLDGYLVTGKDRYREVVEQTLGYLTLQMRDPGGGIYSTEDADSEGVEGKFYVWQRNELDEVLGESRAERFARTYDVSEHGNWEGNNILHLPQPLEEVAQAEGWNVVELREQMSEAREMLLQYRNQRIRPGLDDKVLTSWNGLAIDAFARAARALQRDDFQQTAIGIADFIDREMRDPSGRLLHTWRQGRASLPAYLDDYAFLANGLTSLYEATMDEEWIVRAVQLVESMRQLFADTQRGGFFYTSHDHEQLIARNKDFYDSSIPSGNGMAATVLTRLGHLCGRHEYLEQAQQTVELATSIVMRSPTAAGQMLLAADSLLHPTWQIVLVADDQPMEEARRLLDTGFHPHASLVARQSEAEHGTPLDTVFAERVKQGSFTAYVCQKFACQAPVDSPTAMMASIDGSE